ncbi:MAG: taurine dioxygenase [Alphaproteobacteria bacterium]|nr:taurine dioxygenase [Alphaproteobacteria bacterium]
MVDIVPTGKVLGATVTGADLSKPLSENDFRTILGALGRYSVLCIPGQVLEAGELKDFAGRFGELEINVAAGPFCDPLHPEVMILSNIKENGKPIGLADAGQDWHTDMSYSSIIAFANVLYAIKVPRRNGKALGATEFASMHAAYEDLPADIKRKLDGKTVTHDFAKYWDKARAKPGSTRKALTEEQRRKKPPVTHPVFLTHPITGRKVLYCNPGYAMRINELPQDESDALLAFLFKHQLQPKYCYAHEWTEGDVLMWDNIGTLHQAWPDYTADEHRLIKRCQVMADRVFDPQFSRQAVLS